MNRIAALVWGAAAALLLYCSLTVTFGPKADAAGWLPAIGFAMAALYCAWRGWREGTGREDEGASLLSSFGDASPPLTSLGEFPGAGRRDPIPLETQIEELA